MALKVTLKKSFSGSSERQLATITGLGLKKFGDVRILKDTPAIRGMVKKMAHLVSTEEVNEVVKTRVRTKPKKIRVRDAARAAAVTGSAEKRG
jgi:large subunit ribosomal protein L30